MGYRRCPVVSGYILTSFVLFCVQGLMIYEMLSGINPFKLRNKNKFEKLQMITDRDIEMRPEFSDEACSLLRGLLKRNPKERLGSRSADDLKNHIFFDSIDWQAMY